MEQEHDEKEAAESLAGIQGQGGDSRLEGRQDAGGTGTAVRCAYEPDYGLEDTTTGTFLGRLWRQAGEGIRAGHPDHAGQDWSADAGERFFHMAPGVKLCKR